VCALEDAGWIIRDELDWIYASGFPKGKANLKPAHEPIVLARKPGPLRPLAIDECRIGYQSEADTYAVPEADFAATRAVGGRHAGISAVTHGLPTYRGSKMSESHRAGRWPSNVLLSDPELFDEPNPYVVGSGATSGGGDFSQTGWRDGGDGNGVTLGLAGAKNAPDNYGDSGGYSRFFIIPKADRAERERGLKGLGLPEEIVDIAGLNAPEQVPPLSRVKWRALPGSGSSVRPSTWTLPGHGLRLVPAA
jgi:hypothetical protein